jgi:hypothetical protein
MHVGTDTDSDQVCPRIDLSAVSRRGSIASMSSGRIRPATAPAKMEVQADGMTVTPISAKAPGKFMAVEQAALAAANRMSQDSSAIPESSFAMCARIIPDEVLHSGQRHVERDDDAIAQDLQSFCRVCRVWDNPGTHGKRGPGLDLPSAADVVLHYRIKKLDG